MLKKLGLAAVISVVAAAPAWAQSSCGGEPIPPAIPSVAELGQMPPAAAAKAKHQAFVDVTTWQKSTSAWATAAGARPAPACAGQAAAPPARARAAGRGPR